MTRKQELYAYQEVYLVRKSMIQALIGDCQPDEKLLRNILLDAAGHQPYREELADLLIIEPEPPQIEPGFILGHG